MYVCNDFKLKELVLNDFLSSKSIYLRHGSGLHSTVSEADPKSMQFFPPFLGEGLAQVLTRVFKPPAQLALQSDHLVHSV